jgi:hypothetical protein
MKTRNILFVLMVILTASFIGCNKDNIIPLRTVSVKAYGGTDFICGVRLSSWEDGQWQKSKYTDSTTIQLSYVQLPDTLSVGSWGNRLVVYSNDVMLVDTSFSEYTLLIIPIE